MDNSEQSVQNNNNNNNDDNNNNLSPNNESVQSHFSNSDHKFDYAFNGQLSNEEQKLATLLIDHVLPPFTNSIRLQALVVYQADQGKINSLLINHAFKKNPNGYSIDDNQTNPINMPDFVNNEHCSQMTSSSSSFSISSNKLNDYEAFSPIKSGPRRKRKLAKPCKITQSSTSSILTNLDEVKNVSIESTIQSSMNTMNTLSNPHSVSFSLNQSMIGDNGKSIVTTNSFFVPVSAVTLFPHLSVFSLPVTVLSTVPRPILPRISNEKQSSIRSTLNFIPSQSTNIITTNCSQTVNSSLKNPSLISSSSTGSFKSIDSGTTGTNNLNESNEIINRRYAKSFVCNQCRKVFTSLSCLCEHTFEVHKAFRCTICGAQFTQRSNLQRHSLRHVGFKPFLCKLCDRAYYRKDHLVRHIELSHPGSDPRTNLTVKLSSAECLDYLDQLNGHNTNNIDQNHIDTLIGSKEEVSGSIPEFFKFCSTPNKQNEQNNGLTTITTFPNDLPNINNNDDKIKIQHNCENFINDAKLPKLNKDDEIDRNLTNKVNTLLNPTTHLSIDL